MLCIRSWRHSITIAFSSFSKDHLTFEEVKLETGKMAMAGTGFEHPVVEVFGLSLLRRFCYH